MSLRGAVCEALQSMHSGLGCHRKPVQRRVYDGPRAHESTPRITGSMQCDRSFAAP
ncbi:hypothetical protein [Nannocystis pusilla]|uniref:hypothetical protein n=1 Tax=Nannocystis pusilla TaxID=889268 RepID=UPI003DA660E8